MKKILLVFAAVLGLAFFASGEAQAGGGPYVSVSFGIPVPVAVYPARDYYYCDPAPVYYRSAPRRYYPRTVRAVYRERPYRYYGGGYRSYYRGRYCD